MNWRILSLMDIDPYRFQSVREAVLFSVKSGISPSTVTLLKNSIEYVSIGGKANIAETVNLDYCMDMGIPVSRSIIPHSSSAFNSNDIKCNAILNEESVNALKTRDSLKNIFSEVALNMMGALGLQVENPVGTNNLNVAGKKVGTFAVYSIGKTSRITIVSISFIIDFNVDLAEKALISKRNMRETMTTITNVSGRTPSFNEVKNAVMETYVETLGIVFEEAVLTPAELLISEELLEGKYRSDSWIKTGRWSPVRDYGG